MKMGRVEVVVIVGRPDRELLSGHSEVPQGSALHRARIIEAPQKRSRHRGHQRLSRTSEGRRPGLVLAELDGSRLEAVRVAGNGVRTLERYRALADERGPDPVTSGECQDLIDHFARPGDEVV